MRHRSMEQESMIIERKRQNQTKHSSGYAAKDFARLQPIRAVFAHTARPHVLREHA